MDTAVEVEFRIIIRFVMIYIIVTHLEAVVERMFSKMDFVMTKNRCSLK